MIKQTVFPLFFLFAVFSMTAQEVCDNGVDDNGNGLIDLYDPACICEGIGVEENGMAWILKCITSKSINIMCQT